MEPRALAVTFTARSRGITAVHMLRDTFPGIPIFARALDSRHAAELKSAGADNVIIANSEAGAALAGGILASLGVNAQQLTLLSSMLRQQMDASAQRLIREMGKEGANISSDDDIFKLDGAVVSQVCGCTCMAASAALACCGVHL